MSSGDWLIWICIAYIVAFIAACVVIAVMNDREMVADIRERRERAEADDAAESDE